MAEVIAYLASRLNRVDMYIEKTDGSTYSQNIDITCTVKQEWDTNYAGVLEINIPVPSDAPAWDSIRKEGSRITIYDSTDERYFVTITFSILDKASNYYTPGQTWKICLIFPPLFYY